jgi:putative ABC exporter
MIHPALPLLIKTQYMSKIRRALRSLKTLRGVMYFLVGLFVFTLWIGPSILMAFTDTKSKDIVAPYISAFLPFLLLIITLLALTSATISKAINFTAGELEFLFPGPFKRRDLVIYKIITSVMGIIFVALFISCFFMRFTNLYIACYLGILFTLLFLHFFSMAVAFISLIISKHAYTPSRKNILITIGVLVVLGLWKGVDWQTAQELFMKPLVLAQMVKDNWFGGIILAPFEVFVRTIMAPSFYDLLLWASAAAGIDLILLGAVISLDANYLETSLSVSEKKYAKIERMRRGGVAAISSNRKTAKWSLPDLPWLHGIGPILWRQMTSAMRNSKGVLLLLFIVSMGIGPMIVMKGVSDESVPFFLIIITMYSIFLTQWFPFDFRSDIDRMDWMKMIPIDSLPIAIGQILTPVLIVSILEMTIFGGLAIGVKNNFSLLLAGILLAPSFNLLLFGLENLIFLLYPVRIAKVGPGDFQGFGRMMVLFFLKFVVIILVMGSIIGLGVGGYFLFDKSIIVFIAISLTLLTGCGLAIIQCIAWAFDKFDPSIHTPA